MQAHERDCVRESKTLTPGIAACWRAFALNPGSAGAARKASWADTMACTQARKTAVSFKSNGAASSGALFALLLGRSRIELLSRHRRDEFDCSGGLRGLVLCLCSRAYAFSLS